MNYVKEYSEFIKNFFDNEEYIEQFKTKNRSGFMLRVNVGEHQRFLADAILSLEKNYQKMTRALYDNIDELYKEELMGMGMFLEALFWKEHFEFEKAKNAAKIVDDAIVKASEESKS